MQPAKPGTYRSANPLTIALLYGGVSNERDVSILSAENARSELEAAGHTVKMIDTGAPGFVSVLEAAGAEVAFIALHGKGGEDGTIQGLLELVGIPYTGSGVLASALAMDKHRCKAIFSSHGLKTPAGVIVRAAPGRGHEGVATQAAAVIEQVGLPCVIKPVSDGSSVGISIVHTKDELPDALANGFAYSDELLGEAYVAGTEVTVPVIGNDEPEALPVIEIVPGHEFYDYESKYRAGGSQHIIPARLDEKTIKECEKIAIQAHVVIGCRGISRTDLIVDPQGVPWVIETNTVPGMTATSLVPDAARAAGISTTELYDRLVAWALEDETIMAAHAKKPCLTPSGHGQSPEGGIHV
ncbi:MAG: D-alanine--D-alanine ligase [Coriobacteriales bacterium]|jgi:D-alanine-D-alanine ligase|nr:D-alanine--D-alanine ligase [Coriobacteriales bacterium]